MSLIKIIVKGVITILLFILILALAGFSFYKFAPVFGGTPDEISQNKINNSKNYNGKQFRNIEPTVTMTKSDESPTMGEAIAGLLFPPKGKNPLAPLPSKLFDQTKLSNGDFTWFGHSTVLFKLEGMTVITDPVFYRASPVFIGGKPFKTEHKNTIETLPFIDVVVISHDHYDHLDIQSIKEIDSKVGKYLVPLGIKGHLQRWNIDSSKITEFDWYEGQTINDVTFTLTPTRHFSGRKLNDANKTLWGSWVVKSASQNVYFSGDGGYSDEFKKIGEKFGPFDVAFMEDGAYSKGWSQIHMFPEQSVKAAKDLNAKTILPIHWGKFDLSNHTWTDPIERIKDAAEQENISVATPLIGEIFNLSELPQTNWWTEL